MTTFVKMHNPSLTGDPQVDCPTEAEALYAAHGWLAVDGNTPAPEAIYLTPGTGDLRYLKQSDVSTSGTATGDALRAAFVPHNDLSAFGVYLPEKYGAVADGTADDRAAVQAAITAAATAGGGRVLISKHYLSATLSGASGVDIVGRDVLSGFVLPTGGNFAAVTLDAVNSVTVERFTVSAATTQTTDGGTSVSIRGNALDVTVKDVFANKLHCGFRSDGGLGAVAGTVQRILFERCVATNTNQYGFRIDECAGLTIAHCTSSVSGLDGIKLRKHAKYVHVIGGKYSGSTGGDGLDGYAGGEEVIIEGGEFFSNFANGITLKTDALNRDDAVDYGMPKAITVVGVRCHDNTGNGLWIGRVGNVDDPTVPLLTRVTVLGGSFVTNGNRGIVILARSVTLDGVQCARNQLEGIAVLANSLDITIANPRVGGNGLRTPGTIDGINVAGKRVQIIGGASLGVDPDAPTSDTDLAAATKSQRYGVRYEVGATGGSVLGITCMYNATGTISDASASLIILYGTTDAAGDNALIIPNNRRILARKSDGSQLTLGYVTTGGGINFGDAGANASILGALLTVFPQVNYSAGAKFGTVATSPTQNSGTGTPEGAVTAPPGSIWMRTDGAAGSTLYVKQTGTGNTGWFAVA